MQLCMSIYTRFMFSLSFSLLRWEFILQSLFAPFSLIHFSHFFFVSNWKQCSQSQKPIEESKNCSSEMLVCLLYLLHLLFYYFDVGAMKKQDRPTRRYLFYFQYIAPPCWYMEFKQHEVVVIWCYHITWCASFHNVSSSHVSFSNCHSSIFAFAPYYKSIIMCYNQMFWY
jgi:hypothetical protein